MAETKKRKSGPPRMMATKLLLPLPAKLNEEVRAAAELEGLTVAEWIRRACRERALRQAAKRAR